MTQTYYDRVAKLTRITQNGYSYIWNDKDSDIEIISHGVCVFRGDLSVAYNRYGLNRHNVYYVLHISISGDTSGQTYYPIEFKYYGLEGLKIQTKHHINGYIQNGYVFQKWEYLNRVTLDMFKRLGDKFVLGLLTADGKPQLTVTLKIEWKD